jgi:hypothetical protein
LVFTSCFAGSVALKRVLPLFAACTVAVTTFLVFKSAATPYRQDTALASQSELVELGGARPSRLSLSAHAASYVRTLRTGALAAGFSAGTPVLDLTGNFPGTVFAIGGSPPGVGWLIGLYPGSSRYIEAAFDLMSCTTLAEAWLLIPKGGPDPVYSGILQKRDLAIAKNYDVAAHASVRDFRAGNDGPWVKHQLLKPRNVNSEYLTHCRLRS